MSLFRCEGLRFGLSAHELVCLDAQGQAQRWPLPDGLVATGAWAEALAPALEAWRVPGRSRGRVRVVVVVANDVAQHWLCAAPAGTASLGELQSFAAARRAQIHGDAPQDWRVSGDWQARGAFLCAGVPAALVDALRGFFAKHGRLDLVTELVSAWAPRGPARLDRPTGWLCLDSASGAALVQLTAGRLRSLRTWRLPEPGQADRAERGAMIAAEARREALRLGEAPPADIRWLDLRQGRPLAVLIRTEGASPPTVALQGAAADGPVWSPARWCAELAGGVSAWRASA